MPKTPKTPIILEAVNPKWENINITSAYLFMIEEENDIPPEYRYDWDIVGIVIGTVRENILF